MPSSPIYTSGDIRTLLAHKKLDSHCQLWRQRLENMTTADVERTLSETEGHYSLEKLLMLISPAAENYLEEIAQLSQHLTIQRFGRTIRLYAPLYLSNYCINGCLYCGFSTKNKSQRIRLTIEQAMQEADVIASQGIRDILLVSSEDREFVNIEYLAELADGLRTRFSSISMEVYEMDTTEYTRLFKSGIEAVTLYQETYDREGYARYHPSGPKADYDRRLTSPDRIAAANMRNIGIGVLLGLGDWRLETLALAEHAHYLFKRYWKSRVSISFPRLRPAHAVKGTQFSHLLSDKDLVQMITALRLCFPDVGLVLSTRESAQLRDRLIQIGITKVSAGSKTQPGGYSQHMGTVEQFEIDDKRDAPQVAEMIRAHNLEPVWKDWDRAFAHD